MICPRCLTQLHCHCRHCFERNKDKVPWLFTDGNEPITCGKCAFIFRDPYEFDGPDGWKAVRKWCKDNPEKTLEILV